MVLQCLTWIPELWIQLVNSIAKRECSPRHLPDNIIFDILTRLPPESVIGCRKVCRQWFAVTSSPYFVNMHRQKTASHLLVQIINMNRSKREELTLLIFDEDTKKFKKMRAGWIDIKEKTMAPVLEGCYHTKLVFQSWSHSERYYLCDLLTAEKVMIKPPKPSYFIGIFFHPVAKEYRMLFHCEARTKPQYVILIYSCGNKTWRELYAFSYKAYLLPYTVELNGNIHWIARWKHENAHRHSIMMFNMDTEKFSYAPHPGRDQYCHMWSEFKYMYLLEMEGLLTFCNVDENFIRIWVMEDYMNWSWTFKYMVDLNQDAKQFPFTCSSSLFENEAVEHQER